MQERRQFLEIGRREYFEYCGAALAGVALNAAYFEYKLPSAYVHLGMLSVLPALVIPQVDGEYTPVEELERTELGKEKEGEGWTFNHEWEDARLIPLRNAFEWVHGVGNFAMKHDENWLYGIIDFISDKNIDGGMCFISVDTTNNGGDLPQTDDYLFAGEWQTRGSPILYCYMRQGTGKETEVDGWGNTLRMKDASMACSKAASPRSDVEHSIYEFAISKKYFGNSSVAGVYLSVWDPEERSFMIWPFNEPRLLGSKPSLWGDVEFLPMENKYAIPEFSHAAGPVASAGIAAAAALAGYSTMKKRKYLKSLAGLALIWDAI